MAVSLNKTAIRRILVRPLRWASLWSGHALRHAKAIRLPRILMYHAIGYDEVSAEQFRWQLKFLRNEFELISLERLVERLASGSVSGDEVAITFDDGVRNHFAVAYPLLREHDAPATFFVCPGLIESGSWIWRMELRLRLALLSDAERTVLAQEGDCTGGSVEEMMTWTKRLPLTARHQFEANVIARTREFDPSPEQIDECAPMTWQQLLELDPRLITIGSHTSTHPILTTLPPGLLQAEISDSKDLLEQRLDRDVDLFCYPNGANDAFAIEVVRKRYRAAVTARQDFVSVDTDKFTLPRIPGGGSQASFARRLHRPTS